MSTLKERLEEVMQTMGWTRADLVRVSKQSSSVVSQWLGHGAKPINKIGKPDAAIYLERATGFSGIWIAYGKLPKRVGEAWPFTFDRQRFEALSAREQGMVEHAARAEIERIEQTRQSKHQRA